MAATGVQLNWTGVTFTPSGGSLTTFTRVTSVEINPGGQLAAFSGDNDSFVTVVARTASAPSVTVTGGNIAQFQGFASGTTGAFAAIHKDARGGSSGDIVYALANAVVQNAPGSGSHNQFGSGSITFQSFSSDGSTNPLSFTRA